MWLFTLFTCIFFLHAVYGIPTSGHILHERRSLDSQWRREQKLPSNTMLPLRIALAQQNLHRAGELLDRVSHPASPEYGRHWTAQQVADSFSASDETISAVKDWLSQNNVPGSRLSHHRNNWLEVNVTVREAEQLLYTEYYVHKHENSGTLKVACDEYWIPETLRGHIDLITPTVHFETTVKKRPKKSEGLSSDLEKRKKTCWYPTSGSCPSCAPGENPGDPKTYIGDCIHFVSPACVRALYGIPEQSTVKPFVGARAPIGVLEFSPTAYGQVDLDDFFSIYTNLPCGTHPKLVSIGGGVAPQELAGLHAITPFDYGTLFEPDGDFEITMALVPNPDDVVLYQLGPNMGWDNFLDALDGSFCNVTGANDECGSIRPANVADVISISWTRDETTSTAAWLQRQCNEYMKLGIMGITVLAATGDSGVGDVCTDPSTKQAYKDDTIKDRGLFNANFPASCPYVTAVGATAIPSEPAPWTPTVAEVAAYTAIISGGGFSNIFSAPDYQKDAMAAYKANGAPDYPLLEGQPRYNNSGVARGYPDISANGFKISVYSGEQSQSFSGTSGSAPILAGVIALINAERQAVKDATGQPVKGSVGFINPVLYAHPEILNDILVGDNHGCGTAGFTCQAGWDPVTGLGTPKYAKMKELWVDQLP